MQIVSVPTSLSALLSTTPQTFPSTKGTVYIWEPAPRLIVTRVVGVLTSEAAQVYEMAGRRVTAKFGSHTAFHDWQEMTDYESEARAKLTSFGLEIMKTLTAVHFYTASTIVRLAVQAASLAIRGIRLHDSRPSFETELRKALTAAK